MIDLASAPGDERMRPRPARVGTLMLDPAGPVQADAAAVLAAGRDEKAVHDAIAITARVAVMQRTVEGHGFTPRSPGAAARLAEERAAPGYVSIFPERRGGG